MKTILCGLIGVILSLNSSDADAAWSERALEWAETYDSQKISHFATGEVASVWGYFRASLHSSRSTPVTGLPLLEIPQPGFLENSLKVVYLPRTDESNEVLRSPLLVFLPGVFGGNKSPLVTRAASNFSERGYHFVAIPNSFSTSYLESRPRTFPGNIRSEAKIVIRITEAIKKVIGPENISSVYLVGESYGGFLATAVLARDRTEPPVFDGKVTAFSPPLHRTRAMEILDKGYDRIKERNIGWKEKFLLAAHLSTPSHFLLGPLHSLSVLLHTWLGTGDHYFYKSFRQNLVEAHSHLRKHYSEFRITEGESSFSEHSQKYGSNNLRKNPSSLIQWIQKIPPERRERIRYMTADDPLNEGVADELSWNEVSQALNRDQLIRLKSGGHGGYIGLESFQEFLDDEFGPRPIQQTYFDFYIEQGLVY